MAKIRCSNCEKSVSYREKSGKVYNTKSCKATGQKITGKEYFMVRKCEEFYPRSEYILQFESPIDKAMEMIERGKRIRDIVDPL
jgi:hypothetical protein